MRDDDQFEKLQSEHGNGPGGSPNYPVNSIQHFASSR